MVRSGVFGAKWRKWTNRPPRWPFGYLAALRRWTWRSGRSNWSRKIQTEDTIERSSPSALYAKCNTADILNRPHLDYYKVDSELLATREAPLPGSIADSQGRSRPPARGPAVFRAQP